MANVDIPKWLKRLPSAPEFYPTDTEFADPVAYISKIEKEASAYGICKVIPPLPKPSRKYVLNNLNRSLMNRPELGSDMSSQSAPGKGDNREVRRAVFTTRQQELGQSTKRTKGVGNSQQPTTQKQVWQSGEIYTVEQFESKSKMFSRSVLSTVKEVSPLVVEALFWKAASEKPLYIEYANDVPGSAFGEVRGLLNYLCGSKRKRRRIFSRNNAGSSNGWQQSSSTKKDPHDKETGACSLSDRGSTSKSTMDELPQSSKNRAPDSDHEMEGTAGWKLSNSPWNLQVIARSAGSLTRFMLDDIPGVTSPMIYLGMLFSWFAWHVEDHELHSLNFLHMGSPKTWYAVPADHALAFEEVVRGHAYGGEVDRLAALKRLGEKTTLLSPEVLAASGIPCYRLVQNPGEFVVTFPRAYHVGFSHGFNCGEAANFGTPHWLQVAREAAVRRAAMDHLPMLSHQQLLYLLTMSFISRVPSFLLPGVRSSRLRDRLKEERELSVKKAFIEDMLKENKMLDILLSRDSAFYAVLWNPELLPFHKGFVQQTEIVTDTPADRKDEFPMLSKDDDSHNHLSDQINGYMKSMNEFYLDDADLSSDFQVDSGTLACVACGILGFPFMSLVQPSKDACVKFLSAENHSPKGIVEVPNNVESRAFGTCNIDEDVASGAVTKFCARWNTSCGFFRPRSFCLEHAVQVQALLQPKGGANVLVICHSDFEKIKGNAIAVAQEIGSAFKYMDVPLGSASVEDLNLINLAIDDEDLNACQEDWTTQLGINLRYCIKARKNSPLKQIQHALKLVGLFSAASSSKISDVQWAYRKLRSKRALVHQKVQKSCGNLYATDGHVKDRSAISISGKKKTILHYSRRKFRGLGTSVEVHGCSVKHSAEETPASGVEFDPLMSTDTASEELALSSYVQTGNVQSQTGHHEESVSRESLAGEQNSEGMKGEVQACASAISECLQDIRLNKESCDKDGISHGDHFSSSAGANADKFSADEVVIVDGNMRDEVEKEGSPSQSILQSNREGDDHPLDDVSHSCDPASSCAIEDVDDSIPETSCILREGPDPVESDNQVLQETQKCNITDDATVDNKLRASRVSKKSKSSAEVSVDARTTSVNSSKRKRESKSLAEDLIIHEVGFSKSPCEGLRPRYKKGEPCETIPDSHKVSEGAPVKKVKKPPTCSTPQKEVASSKRSYRCNLDGCRLSFKTKADLALHMRNRCPFEKCGKKFSKHRYAMIHQRVHDEDRPLKCTWKGCNKTFKWGWALTEHMRLHTGERPYVCKVDGCGLTFRYVSDFSRHRRRTGHLVDPS